MLTYRVGAAGDITNAKQMADHLLEQTQPKPMLDMAAYYQRGMEPSAVGQTTPEPRRDMSPEVARVLGIDPNKPLDREEIANLLNGRRADGKEIPGKAKQKATEEKGRNGYIDLCFSADKSVSVAWAFAQTEAERNIIVQAHRDAVDSTMRYIEKQMAWASKGKAGRDGVEKGRFAWIKFDHYTSRATIALRDDGKGGKALVLAKDDDPATGDTLNVSVGGAGDPNLHTHVAVPNMVLTDSGRVGAIPFQKLEGRIKEFGAVYQAFLSTNLQRARIAVEIDAKTGSARLPAILEYVRDAFSKRTRDAHEAARQYAADKGVEWDKLSREEQIRYLKGGANGSRKAKADDISDVEAWQKQAEALGWKHTTVIDPSRTFEMPAHDVRVRAAHGAALPFIEQDFTRRSVISQGDIRAALARGFIKRGIESDADLDDAARLTRDLGVRQDGKHTDVTWGKVQSVKGVEQILITTKLHVAQEQELIAIAKAGAGDKSQALKIADITKAAERAGLDFSGDHGTAQRKMMEQLGTGGQVAVAIGAAGSGKSAILRPLVDTWKSQGFKVYGAALAWRQSDDLASAGIEQKDRAALAAFLPRVKRGVIKLDSKSVVVIDELGLIGVRQALDLLRLQKKHGFKLVAVGDPKQCQAIEAGPVIELLRKALGHEAVPEILTTIRQQTERERDITAIFREGKAETALSLKREDGTVSLVPGGYREAVAQVVDLWQERHDANIHNPNFTLSISAPSNADARAISTALRARRQARGEIEGKEYRIKAIDQTESGAHYDLFLAVGDRVRLFDRVNASFGTHGGVIGNNGSVLEVRGISSDGITLRTTDGLVGKVKWKTLTDPNTERIRLTYGDVGTIDSLQGATSTEHIDALPGGSRTAQGFKAYVAESRHRQKAWMVTSEGAERQEIVDRRPLGDARAIQEKDIWENMARNLSRQPEKLAATTFLEMAENFRQDATVSMQQGFERTERAEVQDGPAPSLRRAMGRQREAGEVEQATPAVAAAVSTRQQALDSFEERLQAFDQAMASVEDHLDDIAPEHLLEAVGVTASAELPDAPDWADAAPPPSVKARGRASQPLRTPRLPRRHNPVPKEHLDALKDQIRISDLIGQSIKLDRAGHDFKACCPFHNEKTPSFHVSDKRGTYTCFGCGEHGDALDWLKKQHGLNFQDSIKYLEDRSGITLPQAINQPRTVAAKGPEWKPVYPVPENAPPLIQPSGRTARIFNPKQVGLPREWAAYRPAHVASYQDVDGKQVGYVIRVEIKDKDGGKDRKFTPQVTWVVPANTPSDADMAKVGRWALFPMADPRPLYHAERLKQHPDALVIVVAGEKKADALQKVVGTDAVVVSWAGGDNARQYVDFKPLAGRNVVVWPDADDPGIAAALGKRDARGGEKVGAVKMIQDAGAHEVRVVNPPKDVEKGWDCGDFVKGGAKRDDVRAFLEARTVTPKQMAAERRLGREREGAGVSL